jgi:hypothetical protein
MSTPSHSAKKTQHSTTWQTTSSRSATKEKVNVTFAPDTKIQTPQKATPSSSESPAPNQSMQGLESRISKLEQLLINFLSEKTTPPSNNIMTGNKPVEEQQVFTPVSNKHQTAQNPRSWSAEDQSFYQVCMLEDYNGVSLTIRLYWRSYRNSIVAVIYNRISFYLTYLLEAFISITTDTFSTQLERIYQGNTQSGYVAIATLRR